MSRPTAQTASTPFMQSARDDELLDLRDHLVHFEVGRVDLDRVLGGPHVDRVLLVAHSQVGRERVGADARAF